MKSYIRVFITVILLIAVMFTVVNLVLSENYINPRRDYLVEINRLATAIQANGVDSIDSVEPCCVTNIVFLNDDNAHDFYNGNDSTYVIRQIDNQIYRFDYTVNQRHYPDNDRFWVNFWCGVVSVAVLTIMLYILLQIIIPFNRIKDIPIELARGELVMPLAEHKGKLFGQFVWGLNVMREQLQYQKSREASLLREKNTLIMALSHDIKTPLSAIKLYAKALERDLYTEKQKRAEAIVGIDKKADEIGRYVSQLIDESQNSFVDIEVDKSGFFLKQVVDEIMQYYSDKLALVQIDFLVGEYQNCFLVGNVNSAVEVVQNVMENAIKYGDGEYIDIQFDQEEDCKLMRISNGGSCLPKSELTSIFQSYWRGSNVKNVHGNGLGLYICRQFMRKMDGEIFAEQVDDKMCVTIVFRKS